MALFNFGKGKENAPAGNVPVSQVLAMRAQGANNSQIANQLRAAGFSLTQIRDAMAQAEIKSAVMPGGADMGFNQNVPTGGPMPEFNDAMMGDMGQMPGMNMQQMPDMGNMQGMNMQMQPGMEQMEMPPMPDIPASPIGMEGMGMPMQQQQYPSAPRQAAPEQLINELQKVIEEIIEEKWNSVDDKLNAMEVWKAKVEGQVSETGNKLDVINQRIDIFAQGMMGKTEEFKGTMVDVNTQMEAVEKLMGKLVPSLAEEIKELRSVVEKLKKH